MPIRHAVRLAELTAKLCVRFRLDLGKSSQEIIGRVSQVVRMKWVFRLGSFFADPRSPRVIWELSQSASIDLVLSKSGVRTKRPANRKKGVWGK